MVPGPPPGPRTTHNPKSKLRRTQPAQPKPSPTMSAQSRPSTPTNSPSPLIAPEMSPIALSEAAPSPAPAPREHESANQEYLLREIELKEAVDDAADEAPIIDFASISDGEEDEWLMTAAEVRANDEWLAVKPEPVKAEKKPNPGKMAVEDVSPSKSSVASTDSETHTLQDHFSRSKPVQMIDPNTGEVLQSFASVREAQRAGYQTSHVSACCRKKRLSHKGVTFQYAEERHRKRAHKRANNKDFGILKNKKQKMTDGPTKPRGRMRKDRKSVV